MAASLDGFIARRDGRVDWLETSDRFERGVSMSGEAAEKALESSDCYVMGSRTYETALAFDLEGLGWPYGDKPTFVLTRRELRKVRESVRFRTADLAALLDEQLKPQFRNIWVVGGARLCAECLGRGLADEVRYAIVPIAIGDGISFFEGLHRDAPLHLVDVTAFDTGIVELRYEVRRQAPRTELT